MSRVIPCLLGRIWVILTHFERVFFEELNDYPNHSSPKSGHCTLSFQLIKTQIAICHQPNRPFPNKLDSKNRHFTQNMDFLAFCKDP